MPPWLKNAYLDLGEAEIKGARHNPRILEFWQAIGQPIFDDETPYCAAGVGCWLEEAGIASTRSGLARSYGRGWGVKLPGPVLGAIAVKGRAGSKTYGHVTIVAGRTIDGRLACLGANQGDKLQISPYPVTAFSGADDCGFFWPKDYPQPKPGRFADLPVIDAFGNTVKES
ncbi:MAG: TIGR02594 family protein [Martelella sp.]|nr:TIGR02594 family protein [Martelella sp.]